MKKIKTLILSIALIITATAFIGTSKINAAEDPSGEFGTVQWKIVDGDLQLSGGELPKIAMGEYPNWRTDNKDIITSITIKGDISTTSDQTENLFANLPNLTSISGLSHLKLSGYIRGIFSNNPSLTYLDVSEFDTSNITNLDSAFQNNKSLTTINVTNLIKGNPVSLMQVFADDDNLQEIIGLNTWDTSQVTSISEMFHSDKNLKELDLSSWNLKDDFYRVGSPAQYMFIFADNLKKISFGENLYFGDDQNSWHSKELYTPGNDEFYEKNWYSTKDGGTYTGEEVIERHEVKGYADTYYVKPKYFPITYMDDTTSIKVTQNNEGEYNHVQSLEDLGYVKNGYTFKGWNTKEDGNGTYKEVGTEVKESTTLYGIWEKQIIPAITTDKSVYQSNETVQVSGVDFAPNTEITITLHEPEAIVGTVVSDSNGAFKTTFVLPKGTSLDAHMIKANDGIKTAQTNIIVNDPTSNNTNNNNNTDGNTTTPSPTIPHTGDTTNMNMLLALFGVSGIALLAVLLRKKKQY